MYRSDYYTNLAKRKNKNKGAITRGGTWEEGLSRRAPINFLGVLSQQVQFSRRAPLNVLGVQMNCQFEKLTTVEEEDDEDGPKHRGKTDYNFTEQHGSLNRKYKTRQQISNNIYFESQETSEESKVKVALHHLDWEAIEWFCLAKMNRRMSSWKTLCKNIKVRFGDGNQVSINEALSKIQHKGRIDEYV
ncbi:hypothetical protein ACLOJK_035451 [Asimina triloba]